MARGNGRDDKSARAKAKNERGTVAGEASRELDLMPTLDEASATPSAPSNHPGGMPSDSPVAGPASPTRAGSVSASGAFSDLGNADSRLADAETMIDAPPNASGYESAPGSPATVPTDYFPGYEVLKEIHRGGQGVVYQAMQLATKRKVAVKVMHGGATVGSTGKVRFDREVQILGQLNHPNIVKLHDSGVSPDGSFFYVMDYISGQPLDELLRDRRKSERTRDRATSRAERIDDTKSMIAMMVKICEGVNAAHLRGVIHRDIKPANVRIDARGEPIVVDFGLAKTIGEQPGLDSEAMMTMTGQFVGSLPWASPEQAAGDSNGIDIRTDVYSLGVMLYQILTGGKFPYPVTGNMRDVLDNIQRAEPARPTTVRKSIGGELETIVLKSLAKDPARRYQTSGELGRDLERFLEGEAIEAKSDSGWYLVSKTIRRHKLPAAFAATVALMTVVFAGSMTAAYGQAEAARKEAVAARDAEREQKERAESNLSAIRGLANTFLFDFHDAIADLRGATPARELVLENALTYLEQIQAQAVEDPEYVLELADAHDRVGDIHGALYQGNTGTTEDALRHYTEAKRLRDQVAVVLPDDERVIRGLASSEERIAGQAQKSAAFEDAIAGWERQQALAARLSDEPLRLRGVARVADLKTRVATSLDDTERIVLRLDEARAAYDDAIDGWTVIESDEAERQRGVLLNKLAQLDLLEASGRYGGDAERASELIVDALARAERATGIFERLLARDPASGLFARDLFLALHNQGLALSQAAGLARRIPVPDTDSNELLAQSLERYQEAEDVARTLAIDESNLEAQRDLGLAMNKVGNIYRQTGRLVEASDLYDELIERRTEVYRADPIGRHQRDLALALYKRAEVNELRADTSDTDGERDAYLRSALMGYEAALDRFRDLDASGAPAERELSVVTSLIDRVREKLENES
ncbi:MAG: protein kinase [Planctomycetota bacterium]